MGHYEMHLRNSVEKWLTAGTKSHTYEHDEHGYGFDELRTSQLVAEGESGVMGKKCSTFCRVAGSFSTAKSWERMASMCKYVTWKAGSQVDDFTMHS